MYSISLCFVWINFFVIVISGDSSSSLLSNDDGTYCDGTGWLAYRDEKCFKLIKQWATRDGAKALCAQEGSDGSVPQLATIKSVDEQAYLTELIYATSAVMINVWIGAKRQDGNKFVWDDGTEVGEFTNWAEGNPTENVQLNCVAMKPAFLRSDLASGNTAGQWRDVPCEMPNYVIYEKLPRWSFAKLQKTLIESRKELKDSNDLLSKELEDTKNQLSEELGETKNQLAGTINELTITKNQLSQSTARLGVAEAKIEETKNKLVPIGFIYTQLPNERAPTEIWPWMTWQDVSSAYAGVFFRVNGGGAAPVGQVQGENAPHIKQIKNWLGCPNIWDVQTVIGGWSEYVLTSGGGWNHDRICLTFLTSGGEVRPRNMAIRVWKRIN